MAKSLLSQKQMRALSKVLLENRNVDKSGWYWINEPDLRKLGMKRANKFLFACVIDYQELTPGPWDNAKKMTEEVLEDPEDLWRDITAMTLPAWRSLCRQHNLHHLTQAHDRLWNVGQNVVRDYDGDAEAIWHGRRADEVLDRLIEVGVGPQLSRMAVGGLFDCGWVSGECDLKADIHVRRTIGSVCLGRPAEEEEGIDLARQIHPENPWLLDNPLWNAGRSYCRASVTYCHDCYLNPHCQLASSS